MNVARIFEGKCLFVSNIHQEKFKRKISVSDLKSGNYVELSI